MVGCSKRTALALLMCALAVPALASFHLMKIVEVFAGTAASPNAQYVVLQMYSSGQNSVGGTNIIVYNAAGTVVGTFPFTGDVAAGGSQAKILIATTQAQTFFGVTADLVVPAAIIPAGGKVCFETIDCVTWGSYGGAGPVGTPYNASTGLVSGTAAKRRLNIAGGTTVLDAGDDTNNSANDFLQGLPAPRNNAGVLGTVPPATCGNGAIEGLEGCDDGNTVNGDSCSSTCTVTVPPPPSVLSIADVSVAEGNSGTKLATFTVALAPASAAPVGFDIATGVGTAAPGQDFVEKALAGQSIPAGQVGQTFSVVVNGDAEVESNETFTVNLGNVTGATVSDAQALGTISNDDQPTLSVADATVLEGNSGSSTARFVVSLSAPMTSPVSVTLATSDGTAVAGSDYVALSQPGRTIDAGRTRIVFEVAVNGDLTAEADETFTVTASALGGAVLGDAQATGTIVNDEAAAKLPISSIQGVGASSPRVGEMARTEGLVTARLADGFFIQSRSSVQDFDLQTSEGLFVVADGADIALGDLLAVHGRISELQREGRGASLTSIVASHVDVLARGVALPAPVVLDEAKMDMGRALALERFEGMRVAMGDVTVVSPVGAKSERLPGAPRIDGRFYGVATGAARPFIESDARLLVDSSAQQSSQAIAVDAGDRITGLVGVLDQEASVYRLDVDPARALHIQAGSVVRAVAAPYPGEVSLASLDLGRAGPGAVSAAVKVAKAAQVLCNFVGMPDIVVVARAGARQDLRALVSTLNRSGPAPGCIGGAGYRIAAASDNFGVLMRATQENGPQAGLRGGTAQETARSARFRTRDGGQLALFEDPVLVMDLQLERQDGSRLPITVVAARLSRAVASPSTPSHGWPTASDYIAARRLAQARWLARSAAQIQARQTGLKLVMFLDLDGFNSAGASANLLDVVAGAEGSPARLVTLDERLPAGQRYTAIREGKAFLSTHMLVNPALLRASPGLRVDVARVNADFGFDNAVDPSVPIAGGDVDPSVLFLDLGTKP